VLLACGLAALAIAATAQHAALAYSLSLCVLWSACGCVHARSRERNGGGSQRTGVPSAWLLPSSCKVAWRATETTLSLLTCLSCRQPRSIRVDPHFTVEDEAKGGRERVSVGFTYFPVSHMSIAPVVLAGGVIAARSLAAVLGGSALVSMTYRQAFLWSHFAELEHALFKVSFHTA